MEFEWWQTLIQNWPGLAVALASVYLMWRWNEQATEERGEEREARDKVLKVQVEAWQKFADAQDRLIDDIERNAERKEKDRQEEREGLQKQIDDLKAGGVEKDKTITALKKQVGNLTRDIQQRDKQISELAALINDLTDAKDAQNAANKAKDKVIANLRDELNQVKRSRSEAVSEREAKIEKLEERLAKVEQVQKNGTDQLDPKVPEEKEKDDKAA